MSSLKVVSTIVRNKKIKGLKASWKVDEVVFDNHCRGFRITGLTVGEVVDFSWKAKIPDSWVGKSTVKQWSSKIPKHNQVDIIMSVMPEAE